MWVPYQNRNVRSASIRFQNCKLRAVGLGVVGTYLGIWSVVGLCCEYREEVRMFDMTYLRTTYPVRVRAHDLSTGTVHKQPWIYYNKVTYIEHSQNLMTPVLGLGT
jgi:hypothetical protein